MGQLGGDPGVLGEVPSALVRKGWEMGEDLEHKGRGNGHLFSDLPGR